MKRSARWILSLYVLLQAAFLLFPGLFFPASAKERVFVPTSEWVPPVIDEKDALENEPWLLVVKIAQEEIGYVEGPGEDESKYGEWFENKYAAWCSEFVTWCVHEADERYGTDLMNRVFPWCGHPWQGAPWYMQRERFVSSTAKVPVSGEKMWLIGADDYLKNKEYIPYPGDCMWFAYYSPAKGVDHTALVEGVSVEPDGSYLVHVIEGNNPDRVQRNTYRQDWKLIYGYGTPVRRANRIVRIYSRGNDCLPIQQYLHELGYMNKKDITAQFEKACEKAVKHFQRDHGLTVSGMVDLETRSVMEQDARFLELITEYQQ